MAKLESIKNRLRKEVLLLRRKRLEKLESLTEVFDKASQNKDFVLFDNDESQILWRKYDSLVKMASIEKNKIMNISLCGGGAKKLFDDIPKMLQKCCGDSLIFLPSDWYVYTSFAVKKKHLLFNWLEVFLLLDESVIIFNSNFSSYMQILGNHTEEQKPYMDIEVYGDYFKPIVLSAK